MLVVLIVSLDTLAHGFSLLSPWHEAMPRVDVVDGVMMVDDVVDVVVTTGIVVTFANDVAVRRGPLGAETAVVVEGVCGISVGMGDISTGGCVGNGYWSPLAGGKGVPERKW